MSTNIIHGFVVQEVLYSQDLRRVCCVCGAKRKIQFLSQKSVVFKGEPISWRCSDGCFSPS